jgi:hypothetical protein
MLTSHSVAFAARILRLVGVSLGALLLTAQLSGCMTTAVLLAAQYAETLPTFCTNLSSVERALTARCGTYKTGTLLAKDVNTRVLDACPLTNFARDPAKWHGLPELLTKGAVPERCSEAPLLAMAKATPCPAFTQMSAPTLEAVQWLAVADAASVSGPVLGMLTCPEAQKAGLSSIVAQWVQQGYLHPDKTSFSVLSNIHPSSLGEPWVNDLITAGHRPAQAIATDTSGFESALAQGDVAAITWWTQKVPSLVHRAPAKGAGYVPWLPLARTMSPGFAADDSTRLRTAKLLIERGARLDASLPHARHISVSEYARSMQPQMWAALKDLSVSTPAQ